jgi:hypothetical protein
MGKVAVKLPLLRWVQVGDQDFIVGIDYRASSHTDFTTPELTLCRLQRLIPAQAFLEVAIKLQGESCARNIIHIPEIAKSAVSTCLQGESSDAEFSELISS